MPLPKFVEQLINEEAAQVMRTAFDAVLAGIAGKNLTEVSDEAIARKILTAVINGERNAEHIAERLLSELFSTISEA